MQIGLVLSSTPGYSETFFRSKIKGLMASNHHVVLFCRETDNDFNLCKTYISPKRYQNKMRQVLNVILVFISLLPYSKKVYVFYKLERGSKTTLTNTLTKIYFNSNFFKVKLDWLHFGFGTLAIERENLAKSINAKMAVSFRGFDIGVYPLKHPNCYSNTWRKVDKIHVISNDIKTLLYTHGFKNESPVIKITPAIDTHFFVPTSNSQNKTIQFLTVARLHWKKGLDYTLKALAILKAKGVNFHYKIIGDGPQEEYLKFLAYQLNIDLNITFTGKLEREEIKISLQEADIYLQYSVQEGFCNAVLEAQAMELLCVVSDAEGLSENVLHNITGWVVPLRKPTLLAEQIKNVVDLPFEEKNIICQNAKERVQSTFNIAKQQEEFIEFYQN